MKMKKEIKKAFRRARRNVCRYIVGFDTCPNCLKKDRKAILLKGLTATIVIIVSVALFMLMFLMA